MVIMKILSKCANQHFFNGEILANFDLDHESRISTHKVENGGVYFGKNI